MAVPNVRIRRQEAVTFLEILCIIFACSRLQTSASVVLMFMKYASIIFPEDLTVVDVILTTYLWIDETENKHVKSTPKALVITKGVDL